MAQWLSLSSIAAVEFAVPTEKLAWGKIIDTDPWAEWRSASKILSSARKVEALIMRSVPLGLLNLSAAIT